MPFLLLHLQIRTAPTIMTQIPAPPPVPIYTHLMVTVVISVVVWLLAVGCSVPMMDKKYLNIYV